MEFRDRIGLQTRAEEALAGAKGDPRKLMLVYAGASAAVMLLVTLLNFLLQEQIAGTGGLGGIGTRAALESVLELAQLAVNLLLPFWTMGYLHCMLHLVRGQHFELGDLLAGFRNFGPVLRLNLMRGLILMGRVFVSVYLAAFVATLLPVSDRALEILEPLLAEGTVEIPTELMEELTMALLPSLLLFGVVVAALVLPKYFEMRMADYALLDDPRAGAMMAIRRSRAMLHQNKLELLKLDLRFWWFYLLDGLLVVLCYGDLLLPLLGISLPMDEAAASFLFYLLYLVAQVALYVLLRNRVEATYVAAYEALNRDLEEKVRLTQREM